MRSAELSVTGFFHFDVPVTGGGVEVKGEKQLRYVSGVKNYLSLFMATIYALLFADRRTDVSPIWTRVSQTNILPSVDSRMFEE